MHPNYEDIDKEIEKTADIVMGEPADGFLEREEVIEEITKLVNFVRSAAYEEGRKKEYARIMKLLAPLKLEKPCPCCGGTVEGHWKGLTLTPSPDKEE